MPESSNKGGRKPRVSDEDLLDVFRSTTDPVLSTAEVADTVPIKRRGTLNRLQSLKEDGELESKQIGGRNTVWWLSESTPSLADGEMRGSGDTTLDDSTPVERIPNDELAESGGESERVAAEEETPREDRARREEAHTPREDTVDVDAAIRAIDTPGSGETLERRRAAIREMYDHLKEHGTARRRDFADLVDAEDVGYGSFNSFWTNYVKAKDALKQLPNVDAPGEGEHTWRFKP